MLVLLAFVGYKLLKSKRARRAIGISSRLKVARQLLGDNGSSQRLIRTIHGKGFRFVGEVHQSRDPGAAVLDIQPGRLVGRSAQPAIAVLPFESDIAFLES